MTGDNQPKHSILSALLLTVLFYASPIRAQQALNEPPSEDRPGDFIKIVDAGSSGNQINLRGTTATIRGQEAPELKDLSDLCWVGGDRYLAISDKAPVIIDLSIQLEPEGGIRRAEIMATHSVLTHRGEPAGLSDIESICAEPVPTNQRTPDATTPVIYLAEEAGRVHRIQSPDTAFAIGPRPFFTWQVPGSPKMRSNKGIESMTIDHNFTLYVANEDAAEADGPVASFTQGAFVHLKAFRRRTPRLIGYRYKIDPINGDHPFTDKERSGLVELEALPDGRLLALERAAGVTGFRTRLYLIDPRAKHPETVARKRLLWEKSFMQLNANFEGMALGPTLLDGSRSLILIADNNSSGDHLLYALRLEGLPAEE